MSGSDVNLQARATRTCQCGRQGEFRMPDEPAPIVDNAAEAAAILGPLLAGAGARTVAVLHLDKERRLIAATDCADDEAELPVREIISDALRIGSVTLVVGRTASAGDLDAYSGPSSGVRELADAGWRLGIGLTDLLIFSGEECRSLRELGLV
jgi:DNA repair protein RadC